MPVPVLPALIVPVASVCATRDVLSAAFVKLVSVTVCFCPLRQHAALVTVGGTLAVSVALPLRSDPERAVAVSVPPDTARVPPVVIAASILKACDGFGSSLNRASATSLTPWLRLPTTSVAAPDFSRSPGRAWQSGQPAGCSRSDHHREDRCFDQERRESHRGSHGLRGKCLVAQSMAQMVQAARRNRPAGMRVAGSCSG
jgi:hypothetical protein